MENELIGKISSAELGKECSITVVSTKPIAIGTMVEVKIGDKIYYFECVKHTLKTNIFLNLEFKESGRIINRISSSANPDIRDLLNREVFVVNDPGLVRKIKDSERLM